MQTIRSLFLSLRFNMTYKHQRERRTTTYDCQTCFSLAVKWFHCILLEMNSWLKLLETFGCIYLFG